MSSEEPKEGPEKHLKNAQEELKKLKEILFANGSITFTSDGGYTVTDMKNGYTVTSGTSNGATGPTGNIHWAHSGGSMHQDEQKVQPTENRERIYKLFSDHINESLRAERDALKDECAKRKTAFETESSERWRLVSENCDLLNRNKAMERDIRALVVSRRIIEEKLKTASENTQVLWENHAELLEAHEALKSVLRGLEDDEVYNETIADYEKQVDALTTELDQQEADKRQLEAVCDWQLTQANAQIAALKATQLPEWDRLDLAKKIDQMNKGMTVWQISTGAGPFRTILEEAISSRGGADFGMRCRNSRGKDSVIEVSDLTPYAPVKAAKKRPNIVLCFAQLAASFLTALAVSFALSPVVISVMAIVTFVLTVTMLCKI